jgi:hypothetical protein
MPILQFFSNRAGFGHAMRIQNWVSSMKILMAECYLIIFQTGFDMGDPGHVTHSKPTLNSSCRYVQFMTLVVMDTNGAHTENVFHMTDSLNITEIKIQ